MTTLINLEITALNYISAFTEMSVKQTDKVLAENYQCIFYNFFFETKQNAKSYMNTSITFSILYIENCTPDLKANLHKCSTLKSDRHYKVKWGICIISLMSENNPLHFDISGYKYPMTLREGRWSFIKKSKLVKTRIKNVAFVRSTVRSSSHRARPELVVLQKGLFVETMPCYYKNNSLYGRH